jgi:hypothetical protein
MLDNGTQRCSLFFALPKFRYLRMALRATDHRKRRTAKKNRLSSPFHNVSKRVSITPNTDTVLVALFTYAAPILRTVLAGL